ncbi:glycosyltransferase [Moorena sp. SIO3B2]|uniref:glycosyltransferase n=1 Tax=Moorena sp. SIO3B2 TaxID=2607827 RepID=UPI0013CC41E3|nr:glycosyltransferase [Moorena sp. SIO3B2]NEP33671.1 glycosyltransferase family 4 protein [Moorena sp. SIO3B2]
MFNQHSTAPHLYLIVPNIFNFKGGIQVYSTFLIQALQTLYPEAQYDIFLKYDTSCQPNSQFLPQSRFHCFGKFYRFLQNILLTLKIILMGIWQRPTLMITTHINYSIPCYWLKQLTGIPYWVVAHGDEVWNLKHPLRQKALRHANQIIAVSHYTRDRLLHEQKLNPSHLSILPNTFDGKQFNIAPKPFHLLKNYKLSPHQPIILTVSRLGKTAAPHKGYFQIIQALPQIRRQIPEVHYIIVGKGDAKPEIEALVQQLGLEDCVTLAGFVPDDKLCDYYNLCDVFALPSSIEGFGIVYLEALACGKPVLAGNQDGAVEPLENGNLGCLVDPQDVNAIAWSLIQILQGSYPNKMIYQPEQLRHRIIETFELSQFQKTLADLIENKLSYRSQHNYSSFKNLNYLQFISKIMEH